MTAGIQTLFWAPSRSPFGGHVVQMEMTARYLEAIDGISVRTSHDENPEWERVDIVHGFGLETVHVREARRRGIPICLSVIYYSKAYQTGLLGQHSVWQALCGRARMAAVLSLAAARGDHVAKSEAIAHFALHATALYESADLLLPNSQMEAGDLVRDLGVTTPVRVVPNAADPGQFPVGLPWDQRVGVVYAGRLEPRKNQLRLIEALSDTKVPLTIVGGDHPDHPRYGQAVRSAAGDAVQVIGHATQAELARLYGSARVHATPSEFETTGLVSLEAALCGCNIVSTDVGYAREYLRDMAWYCSPYDLSTIREAVLAALSAPPQIQLRQRILDRYTWVHTAEATAAAYRDLIEHRL